MPRILNELGEAFCVDAANPRICNGVLVRCSIEWLGRRDIAAYISD